MNDLEKFREGRLTARQVKLVKRLDCSDDYADGLPEELRHFVNLEELDLSGNGFTQIPEFVWSLTKLKRLYLDDNQLVEFPPQICDLTDLGELGISGNYICAIPPEIEKLTKLRWINAAQNRLSALPDEFAELVNLERVGLSHNLFTEFPQSIPENVDEILLSYNSISLLYLPKCDENCVIELNENPLILVSKEKPTCIPHRTAKIMEGKIYLDVGEPGNMPNCPNIVVDVTKCIWEKP